MRDLDNCKDLKNCGMYYCYNECSCSDVNDAAPCVLNEGEELRW